MMTLLDRVTVSPATEAERLALLVADLRAENTRLRKSLPQSTGDMRYLRQAHRDAAAMLLHRFNGYSISRDNCVALGISERRWQRARALLMTARVHDGHDVTAADFDGALRTLDKCAGEMEAAGTIERLKLRVPPSRQWRRK
jgi:hypothetical protein